MGANEPQGVANLDPRGLIGRIYIGDHQTLLHTKSDCSLPHGFTADVLRFCSYIALYKHMNPWGVASLA